MADNTNTTTAVAAVVSVNGDTATSTESPSPSTPAAPSRSTPTPTIPQKRPLELDSTSKTPSTDLPKPMLKQKPPREKKDSWKKKEAAAAAAAAASVGGGVVGGASGGSNAVDKTATPLQGMPPPGLQRWRLPKPQDADYEAARPPLMTASNIPGGDIGCEFFALSEHPKNRRGFRYLPCTASPLLPLTAYRQTEVPPFVPRLAFEDMNAQVHITRSGTCITTEKGFRMARANIGVREGNWYYECKILRGVNSPALPITAPGAGEPHVRIGWARREAPLDAPVGFDAYSYGLRDVDGQKVHCSRPTAFLSESLVTGDVIGLQIYIPPLKTQREDLLANITNPSSCATAVSILNSGDIIRDRIPIRYKNQLYFEQFEYQPAKELEDVMNPSTTSSTSNAAPKPAPIATRKLQGSFIKIYKNGKFMGTPWQDLLAFLPPCSKPNSAVGGRDLDDGFVGYYPAVSVFRGGAVECNFGPDFWFPPESDGDRDSEMKDVDEGNTGSTSGNPPPIPAPQPQQPTEESLPPLRPVSERYNEQIVEDILYDLVDEVDCFFNTDLSMLLALAAGGTGTGGGKTVGKGGGVGGGEGVEGEGGAGEVGTPRGAEEIKEMELEEE